MTGVHAFLDRKEGSCHSLCHTPNLYCSGGSHPFPWGTEKELIYLYNLYTCTRFSRNRHLNIIGLIKCFKKRLRYMYLIIEWNNNNISIPLPFLCSVQYIPPLLHSFINFISLSLSFIILKLSPFDLCIWYACTFFFRRIV